MNGSRLTKFGSGPREGGMGPDAGRLAHGVDGVASVADLAGVEPAALGRRAEEGGVLADHRGGGVRFGVDVPDVVAVIDTGEGRERRGGIVEFAATPRARTGCRAA